MDATTVATRVVTPRNTWQKGHGDSKEHEEKDDDPSVESTGSHGDDWFVVLLYEYNRTFVAQTD